MRQDDKDALMHSCNVSAAKVTLGGRLELVFPCFVLGHLAAAIQAQEIGV